MLKNALNKSDVLIQLTRSKRVISMATHCIGCSSLSELTAIAINYISELINTDKVALWIHNSNTQTIAKYLDKDEIIYAPNDIGIIGQVIASMAKEVTIEPHTAPSYNAVTDLATELPLVTVPILAKEDNKVVAVFQFVHLKSYFYHESHKRNQFELEMLELLQLALSSILDKRFFSELAF